jgi:hypothetical protein
MISPILITGAAPPPAAVTPDRPWAYIIQKDSLLWSSILRNDSLLRATRPKITTTSAPMILPPTATVPPVVTATAQPATTATPDRPWASIIQNVASDVWGIQSLHQYQLHIIELLVSANTCHKRRALLCVKTGGGKSAVVQMVATILKGIHIILVPLLALGADQVEKAKNAQPPYSRFIKAVHLDELKHPSQISGFKSFLTNMTVKHTLIIVASPQSLSTKLPWNKLILQCSLEKNLVRGIFIDEYHLFASFGSSFRLEFGEVGRLFISKIFRPRLVPAGHIHPCFLVMSASMNTRVIADGEHLSKIHIPRTQYFWSVPIEFARREICVMLSIIEPKQISRVVFGSILKQLLLNEGSKLILYTN